MYSLSVLFPYYFHTFSTFILAELYNKLQCPDFFLINLSSSLECKHRKFQKQPFAFDANFSFVCFIFLPGFPFAPASPTDVILHLLYFGYYFYYHPFIILSERNKQQANSCKVIKTITTEKPNLCGDPFPALDYQLALHTKGCPAKNNWVKQGLGKSHRKGSICKETFVSSSLKVAGPANNNSFCITTTWRNCQPHKLTANIALMER